MLFKRISSTILDGRVLVEPAEAVPDDTPEDRLSLLLSGAIDNDRKPDIESVKQCLFECENAVFNPMMPITRGELAGRVSMFEAALMYEFDEVAGEMVSLMVNLGVDNEGHWKDREGRSPIALLCTYDCVNGLSMLQSLLFADFLNIDDTTTVERHPLNVALRKENNDDVFASLSNWVSSSCVLRLVSNSRFLSLLVRNARKFDILGQSIARELEPDQQSVERQKDDIVMHSSKWK